MKDRKAPPNHLQTLIDGTQLFSWPFHGFGDCLREQMKELFEAVFFYGNKVLKLEKELDTAWFNAYKDLVQAHFDFIMKRADDLTWSGKEKSG